MINGTPHATASSPVTPLLTVLREEWRITGAKPGCEQGGCGACTVLVDGEPRRSCLLAIGTLEGRQVTTVEALGTPSRLAPVQKAFNDRYAAQCGYCTSGMLMAAQALIERGGGSVGRAEVIEALSGHVCRCTGYVKIVDAVMAAAAGEFDDHGEPAGEPPAPEDGQPETEIRGTAA